MQQPNLPLLIFFAGFIGAAVSACIGGIFAFWNSLDIRQSEERRQIRELAVRVAIENRAHAYELGRSKAKEGTLVTLPPLDSYLIQAMSLVQALDGRVKTPEQVVAVLRNSFAMSKAASKEINSREAN